MLFISRTLGPDSPLRRWAYDRGLGVIDQSFLQFSPVDFSVPEMADWWFFYSSRAVQFSADRLPVGVRVAAIGGSTAAALLAYGHRVDFCGNGNPTQTAGDFLAVGEGWRVFFPRARQSRLSVQTALRDRITVLDAVCYDNRAVSPEEPIGAGIYVFTSPLNVSAYLDRWPLAPGARVVAIGPSTGAELLRRGVACAWPGEASEVGVVGLLYSSDE